MGVLLGHVGMSDACCHAVLIRRISSLTAHLLYQKRRIGSRTARKEETVLCTKRGDFVAFSGPFFRGADQPTGLIFGKGLRCLSRRRAASRSASKTSGFLLRFGTLIGECVGPHV